MSISYIFQTNKQSTQPTQIELVYIANYVIHKKIPVVSSVFVNGGLITEIKKNVINSIIFFQLFNIPKFLILVASRKK